MNNKHNGFFTLPLSFPPRLPVETCKLSGWVWELGLLRPYFRLTQLVGGARGSLWAPPRAMPTLGRYQNAGGARPQCRFPGRPSGLQLRAQQVPAVSDGNRGPRLSRFARRRAARSVLAPSPPPPPRDRTNGGGISAEAARTCLRSGEPRPLYPHAALAAEHQVKFVQRVTGKETKPKEFPDILILGLVPT